MPAAEPRLLTAGGPGLFSKRSQISRDTCYSSAPQRRTASPPADRTKFRELGVLDFTAPAEREFWRRAPKGPGTEALSFSTRSRKVPDWKR